MKQTLLLSLLLLLGIFSITSCDDENDFNCDDFETTIAVDQDSLTGDYTMTANATGGEEPYSYLWNTGDNTQSISTFAADSSTYSVVVTDANGCTAEAEVTLNGASSPCNGFYASIYESSDSSMTNVLIAQAGGGTPVFTYVWSTGETTSSITYTDDGTYTVTITDANGCIATASFVVETNESCDDFYVTIYDAGDSTNVAYLYAVISGGTSAYSYLWSTGETTSSIDYTTGGTYSITVTDANGCTAEDEIEVDDFDPCSIFYSTVSAIQNELTTYGYNGTTPYNYAWSTGESTQSITVDMDGTYSATVTDANGCSYEDSFVYEYTDPCDNFEMSIYEFPDSFGIKVIFADVTGSLSNNYYEWSTGETTSSIEVTPPGTFSVTVTNDDGCEEEDTITL